MGGSTVKDITGTVGDTIKDGVKVASAGVYNPDTGSVNLGRAQATNAIDGATMGSTQRGLMPQTPSLPKPEDPAVAAARAKAAADEKFSKELGDKGKGLASTVLAGGISGDTAVLKKKKLLGE